MMFIYPVTFASSFSKLFLSFILVLTLFIEFVKNFNKQQF